jgi:Coenzyme PQQ synthesis protein D (PqqD)
MSSPTWHAASPVPRPKASVADVEIDGERVLYDPDTRAVARLDRVGALLWPALDGEGTVSDLAGDVASAFGVDESEALTDVLRLLEQLDRGGFLDDATNRGLTGPRLPHRP